MNRAKLLMSSAIAIFAVVTGGTLLSQDSGRPTFKSTEYLLLGDATRGAGEPMIAVDPTSPKNIIAVAMGSLTIPPPPEPGMPGQRPHSTITWLAVTHDGGVTWKIGELPLASGTLTRCPDAFADVTKSGQFLAGCEPRETLGGGNGMSAVVTSDDRGDTWGKPADIVSSWGAAKFAPGLKPLMQGASPWDRPFTYIDDSTNVIYGVAKGGQTTIDGVARSQAYITASTDMGKSFGTIYAWDSPAYPQLSRGLGVAAAHGTVAVAYTASKAPASENASCPCAVFGLSKDMGKTFTYHVLKAIPPAPLPPAQPAPRGAAPAGAAAASARGRGTPATPGAPTTSMINLTADQTKAGRFALLTYFSGSTPEYRVMVSEDYGQTWSAPVKAGTTPGAQSFTKPAFEYSREGVLGLLWRAIYPDTSYDIWSSISRDGGKTFTAPVLVSHSRSPGSIPQRGSSNDDIQDFSMDKDGMHMVWGDLRSGFLATWYGYVPLSAF